jgi:hypothetical protein
VHGIAVLGAFCDMMVSECFSYYLIILRHMLREVKVTVKDIYIDIACRLSGAFQRYIGLLAVMEHTAAVAASKTRMLVNWMHANGHDESCQLAFSGRFAKGAAARIGEATEQLWSYLKVRSLAIVAQL